MPTKQQSRTDCENVHAADSGQRLLASSVLTNERLLEKAFQERTAILPGELSERVFDPLRSDPRFQELERRIVLAL
jgi:hypothetical protein